MGYIKRWNVDEIIRQLNSAYYTCTDPRHDGFTIWPIKQDLYRVKWAIDRIIKECPTFVDEPEFLKEHEQEILIETLKKDFK